MHIILRVLTLAVLTLGSAVTSCQDYPNKPLRIATSLAGSGNDLQARLIAQAISGPLGQPVIVDNRAALISLDLVSKAPPDGYTLLLYGSAIWIGPLLQKTFYDVTTDFLPITMAERSPNILVVHSSVAAKSVKDLIALAKAKPGQLNYSSGPVGGSSHLSGALFNAVAGVNIVHVPYKSGGAALRGLVGGEVEVTFAGAGSLAPYLNSGKLRGLASTGTEPSALAPGLPTLAAVGLPGYEAVSITGIFAPAKTPSPVINRLNQEIVRYLKTAEAKQTFLNSGVEIAGTSPQEFAAIIKAEIFRWGKLIKNTGTGIKVD